MDHDTPLARPDVISTARDAEIREVIGRVTRWAAGRDDVLALLLAGSCARGAARPDSDIDLVVLTTDPARYEGGTWAAPLAIGDPVLVRPWGPITERRFVTASGLEVEINIGPRTWADVDPVDAGTRRVVTDGVRVLHDPAGLLAALLRTCGRPEPPPRPA